MHALRPALVFVLLGAVAGSARAQLVVGNDQTTNPTIWLIDVSGVRPTRALISGSAAARAIAVAADDAGGVLYWNSVGTLYRAAYAPSGLLTPVAVGTITGAPSQVTGLAYDPVAGRLIGRASGGLYAVSTSTAAATLLFAMTDQDFGGLDRDPDTGLYYAANDSSLTTTIPGRGLYRITPPLTSPTLTRLASYPAALTDLDGLAVGGGRVYVVHDSPGSIHMYDLAAGAWTGTIPNAVTGSGTSSGAAWAPGLMPVVAAADLRAAVAAPPECSAGPGEALRFDLTTANLGPSAAAGCELRVQYPPAATVVAVEPPGAVTPGEVRWAIGSLPPGGSWQARLDLSAQAGAVGVTAVATSTTDDPQPANNQAAAGTTIRPAPPPAARVTGVFSTLTGEVPGVPGATFTGFGPPAAGASGRAWIIRAGTSAGGTVILSDPQGVRVVAREGVSPLIPGVGGLFPPATIDPTVAVSDEGRWAFSGEDARGTGANDGFVALWNGQEIIRIAQEGQPVPALGANVQFGARRGEVSVDADGRVSFFSSLQGFLAPPGTDEAILGFDGWLVLARIGDAPPWGQVGGAQAPLDSIDRGPGTRFSAGPSVGRWAVGGRLRASTSDPPTSGVDRVGLVDGGVMIQENTSVGAVPVGCMARDVEPLRMIAADRDGSWWLAGSCADGGAWVVRDWGVVAASGGPAPGGRAWAPGPDTFFLARSMGEGVWVLGGHTTPGGLDSGVLMLSDGRELARTNDPVDLDADGIFDDGVYIHSFVPWHAATTSEGDLLAVVRLRGQAAALCGGSDAVIGEALVRVRVLEDSPCDPDLNRDGNPDQDDVFYLINVIGGGDNPAGANPDFNRDGNVDQDDVSSLINVIGGGLCDP